MAAETLKPCCERALDAWVKQVHANVASYPVIQDRPCPACKQIIKVRVYGPAEEVDSR